MEGAELGAHATGEILGEHLDSRVGDRENHAVAGGKDIARLAVEGDPYGAVCFGDAQLGIVARQEHAVVELRRQVPHDLFDGGKVHDEPTVLFQPTFDQQAGAVIMPVEFLATMAGERDEMRGREDQIFFRNGDTEFTTGAHTRVIYSGGPASPVDNRQTSSASHSSRCWA